MSHSRWGLQWIAGALLVSLATACLGDAGYSNIGRQGGRVAADGANLTIDPEVLSSQLQFKIVRANPAQLPPLNGPPGRTIQSDPFNFQTKGGEGMPATASIPLKNPISGETPLDVFQLYEGEWVWLTAASNHPEGSAVALIPALPATVVVMSPPPTAPHVSLRWSLQSPVPSDALGAALGAIDWMHPAGYEVAPEGDIIASPGPLPPGSYQVIPVVQNGQGGAYDGALIADILGNEERRQRHIDSLVALAQESGFAGLELDYRQLDLSTRNAFTKFVIDLAQALHQRGRLLQVDVPLPHRGAGGWDDGAYDWRELGEAADTLIIRPRKDLSFYSARIGETLGYAVTQVERHKLSLGINTSSHEKMGDGFQELSRSQALERAAQIKIEGTPKLISGEVVSLLAPMLTPDGSTRPLDRLTFNQEANALAFTYAVKGERRIVWIENAQSLARKLELAQQHHLGGVTLEGDFGKSNDSRLWQVLNSYRNKGRPDLPQGSDLPIPQWQSSDGSLKEKGPARVSWRLPTPGSYTVSLCLNDGSALGCQELAVTVTAPPPTPTPIPTLRPATPPPTTPSSLTTPFVPVTPPEPP